MTGASRGPSTRGVCLLVALSVLVAVGFVASSRARADETVIACGSEPNDVFQFSTAYRIGSSEGCPANPLSIYTSGESIPQGGGAIWQAAAPPGLAIVGANVSLLSYYVNAGSLGQYGGDFYWSSGSSNITPSENSASLSFPGSPDFGFLLVCGQSTCTQDGAAIDAFQINLNVADTSPPTLSVPGGLWDTTGWIRGSWPLEFSGDSPSGMCSLSATLAGQVLPGTTATPNVAEWHQCATAPVDETVNTIGFPQGADSLALGGVDAAGLPADIGKTIYIDNQPPTISLSGPGDASSSAGTQYVTATATAGPSGVRGITCSVDSGAAQFYPEATAQIPVSGVGEHRVVCSSQNKAYDSSDEPATSAPATFSMKIGQPAVALMAFSKLVDKLRCHRVTERVRIPARWVEVKVHGQRVRVREPARTERVRITHCHPRTVRRRVAEWVTVTRDGRRVHVRRYRTVRVLVLPHVVDQTKRTVAYGRATTVSGWVGTPSGVALAGQTIDVLSAPDNGQGDFSVAAVATSAANGGWSATVPAGPSRLVEASYPGNPTTEGTISAPVTINVPAKVELLKIVPRRVAWGGTIRLVGQLEGGYLPPGGALVRLRIGLGSAMTTYGVQAHVGGNGRFSTTYTFGVGDPSIHRSYWFEIASLPMGDYPYAPARSRRVYVTVGGHPRRR